MYINPFLCPDFPSKETLAHNREGNYCILPRKVPSLDTEANRGFECFCKAKNNLHDLHVSLLWLLGGNVHSKCSSDLEKMVDESSWLNQCDVAFVQQGLFVMLGREILTLCFQFPACA